MGNDISEGAKIAIILIVLGVIMSVVFTILGFTRGATQQGLNTVENNMNAMQLAQFDDYDQKIISGTKVVAALKLMEGQPIAMVVRTKAQMSAAANTGHNYGAVLAGTNGTTFVSSALTKSGSNSFYVYDLKLNSASVYDYNTNYINTTITGNPAYIRTTAKFMSEWIKDSTESIVGIVFTQQ